MFKSRTFTLLLVELGLNFAFTMAMDLKEVQFLPRPHVKTF